VGTKLAERVDLARDVIDSRRGDGRQLAILGLDESGDLLEELHQRRSQTLAVLGADRVKTANRDDCLIERCEGGVVAAVGVATLLAERLELVACHANILAKLLMPIRSSILKCHDGTVSRPRYPLSGLVRYGARRERQNDHHRLALRLATAAVFTSRLGEAPIHLAHDEVKFALQARSMASKLTGLPRFGRGLLMLVWKDHV